MEADLAQRADVTLDGDLVVFRLLLAQFLAELGPRLLQEWFDRGEEQVALADMKDDADVGTFAQIEIAAGQSETANDSRPQGLAQGGAAKTELLLIAALEIEIAT